MKLNHVTILVANRLKAVEFYSSNLGLETIEKGKSRWMKIGDQYLHLAQNSSKPIKNSFYHFCLSVNKIIPFIEKLVTKGIDVFDLDKDMIKKDINQNFQKKDRQFFINDLDGNLIELIDENNEYFE